MDFTLSHEQQMLADTVRRFVERNYALETRRRLAGSAFGFSPENWKTLSGLGLTGLVVAEEFGGAGGGVVETLIVMEEFGRGLVLEPYLSTAVVGAALISKGGSTAQKNAILRAIAAGRTRLALAALEPGARFDLWEVRTRATRLGDGYVIDGRKAVVLHGDSSDKLIVSARTAQNAVDHDGITLFLIDAKAPGVAVKGFPNIDGQRSAEIALKDVHVGVEAVIGEADAGYPLLEWAVDRGIVALCAEAVGAMAKLVDITTEYLRTRQQFGQPISRFQALRHRAADMLIALEQARSITLFAAAGLEQPDPRDRRRAVSAAKAVVGRSGRYIGQQAVQLHGAMGMTDELAVGHYFKRLTCIDMTWGNAEHHTELYGNAL